MKRKILRKVLNMSKYLFYGIFLQTMFVGLLLAGTGSAQSKKKLDEIKVSVKVESRRLKRVFKELERQTGFSFTYNDEIVNEDLLLSLNAEDENMYSVLKNIAGETGISFKRINSNIFVSATRGNRNGEIVEIADPQQVIVSGKVTSADDNEALPGVSILVKGTSIGTTTDFEGKYSLSVTSGAILQYSYIGYQTTEIEVGNQNVIDISLIADLEQLEEVVVVGYGTQQRKDLTGSISSVKGEEIKNMPSRNLAEALQGRVAGVQVTQSGGRPGNGADIVIRGAGSINGTPPLYIVDGIRIGTGNNFNIQDIESIEVMKDASAAAIYGAQAAGGVILITTKRGGKDGKMNINFNGRYGVRTAVGLYDLLETPDYIRAQRAIGIDDPSWDNPSALPNTNWVDELFTTGKEQNYNLSLGGGSQNANYYIGLNYQREDGILINNYFERFSLRINSDFNINEKVTVGESLMAWKTYANPPGESSRNNAGGGIQGEPFRSTPIMPLFDPANPATQTGNWAKNPSGFAGGHPVAREYINHIDDDRYGLEGNVYLNWSILDGLDFRSTLGLQLSNEDYYKFRQFADWGSTTQPQLLDKEQRNWQQYTANFVLTYQKNIGEHGFKAMVGHEAIRRTEDRIRGQASQFPTVVATSFDTKLDANPFLNGGPLDGRFQSVFGRVNYDFAGKYLFQATVRRDGSDKFGPENKWGTFPSASVGWRISDEGFFSGVNFVNDLKVRASYGILGNDNIGQFTYEPAFANINIHSFDDANELAGYSSVKFPNEAIKWEEITTLNIGFDASLFNNTLTFTFDWYTKNTTDMLYNVNIPLTSGYGRHNANPTQVPINIGEIENKGVEFALSYNKKIGDIDFTIGGNASFNTNEVIDLGEGNVPINDGSAGPAFNSSLSRIENGHPMASFFGFQVAGIFQSDDEVAQLNSQAPEGVYQTSQTGAGDLRYVDINGDNQINNDDRTIIGNPWPKAIYGLNFDIRYKGFELFMLFSGVAGVDVFNGNLAYSQNIYGDYNTTDAIFGASFYGDNDLTGQPRLGVEDADGAFVRDPNNNYSNPSSYFIEDGSFFKMKNLQLTYNLPESILSSIKVASARVYFSGQNLFTITNYTGRDPEIAGAVDARGIDYFNSYPHTRLYSVGLELGF
ncbi:MAG: TonB-dependent receptor [Bacteroidota bacterium]